MSLNISYLISIFKKTQLELMISPTEYAIQKIPFKLLVHPMN